MKKFVYKAWDDEFKIVKEEIEEDNLEDAVENIKSKGLKIIYVKEKTGLYKYKFLSKKLNDEVLANFCGQTAMILSSGVSLITGLEIMEEQTKSKRMKEIILEILEGIKKGNNLAAAMKNCGEFPTILTDMVMTGETSGNVDTILYNMENFYKREANIKNKIRSASVYPILIFVVAIGMMLFFNFFVFPQIKDLFADMKLPAITIFVLGIMNFLNNNYLLMISITIITIVFFEYASTIPRFSYILGKITLKAPILGGVKLDIITSRFTRSMGIFLKSGVPIVIVLDNLKLIVGNEFISQKIEKAKNELIAGAKFADSIGNEEIFEPLVTQMLKVGEETGQLDEMMFKLADIYDGKVETGIGRLMSLVEPVLTLVIGLVVGVAILGIALPIMQMTQGVK
ncbi:type II secretion system F family protein [Clostridiaceae bacterium UIB06]|uniref:Type II secretion system F family protein n=1 Tax=Clostridium thailandense TaxID=2794346 RepID=A0A949WXB6_9CLOT|nr:type II secretion system F family protein [Clostridium thailandense]MBV7275752.1 type II secretion system F family protein [Clostridium thailandense]MCH5136787.1 type II secretion system F family protein [Clostridiaceae bacterium UIB06]